MYLFILKTRKFRFLTFISLFAFVKHYPKKLGNLTVPNVTISFARPLLGMPNFSCMSAVNQVIASIWLGLTIHDIMFENIYILGYYLIPAGDHVQSIFTEIPLQSWLYQLSV